MSERSLDPVQERVDAFRLRAQRYLELGRAADAERELRRGLERAPEDVDLYAILVEALAHQERWDEAEEAARRAIALAPDDVRALGQLGFALCMRGKNRAAEASFQDALRLDPLDPWLLYLYGLLLYRTGHLPKAEDCLLASLAAAPDEARVLALLSVVQEERAKRGLALFTGRRGLAVAPDSDVSHAALGSVLLRTGHPFQARRHLREALRLDPSDPSAEEAFLEADRCCRVIYLPMYGWSLLLARLPEGGNVLVWIGLFGTAAILQEMEVRSPVVAGLTLSYGMFAMYTWLADPLVRWWIRLRPPR